MSARRFTHLHVHTHYSLLDGVIPVKALVENARDKGMKAIAVTDHGNMFGAIEFFREAKHAGLKPIIGMEAYITDGSRHEKSKRSPGANFYHLVLLVENEIGYRNLIELSSRAFVEGFYYKPRIDHELLERHSEGLICLSACLSSEVNRPLVIGDDDRARAAAERYQRIFGPDRFFLELQDHGLPEQRRVLEKVPSLARELGLPLVATNDVHYLNADDSRSQEIHLCINTGTNLDDADRLCFDTNQLFLRDAEAMSRLFADFPEAVTNSDDIADMINFELDTSTNHLPVFHFEDAPDLRAVEPEDIEKKNRKLFREFLEEGFAKRYPDAPQDTRDRLEHEIGVIEEMGFVSYFLITSDFIRFARQEGIPVGPGRGSAVGSVVAYCLGITNMDPIQYDLLFERFLNSDRVSMPDIDIDFCMEGRDKVIRYVRDKYGEDRVCQIVTFGTMAARAVIRDVGRVLGISLKEIDAIAKKIPDVVGIKLEQALEQEPQLKELSKDPRYQELFAVAAQLEGLNRHCSTHAAGVVIADRPLTEIVPLYRNGDDITTQYPMDVLESIGLLKMDFLGLRTLTIIDRARKIIAEATGVALDLDRLPLDDPATFQLLATGDTTGIFQLESSGMRELLRRLEPDRFDDLIAVLALYRPGPLGSGMDRVFCERKHGREEVSYLHDALEPLLRETHGVILYQEQVMRIAQKVAGFTLNEADSLRKAMGKKKPEMLARLKDQFTSGAMKNSIPARVAREIFEQIEHFARYGFNKSHSTAYAMISYQTAYLKANYPAAFMAAVLSCEISNVEKLVEYLAECGRMAIKVHPPALATSGRNFSVRDGEIHYGLVAVKGVGEKAADAIIRERDENGPLRSLFDLTSRVDLRLVNKSVLEQLIRCGACDAIGPSRPAMMAVVREAMEEGNRVQADRRAGQLSLFGGDLQEATPGESYPDVPDWSDLEMLSAEKDSLGFYLSGHPLDRFEPDIAPFRSHRVAELKGVPDRAEVTVGVLIGKIRTVQTRKGESMAILQVEDQSGTVEVVVFPQTYRTQQSAIETDAVVLVTGSVEIRDSACSIRADRVVPIAEAFQRHGKRLGVTFPLGNTCEDELFRVKDILQRHNGEVPVSLIFRTESGERFVVRTGEQLAVAPSRDLLEELRALVGSERILVNSG